MDTTNEFGWSTDQTFTTHELIDLWLSKWGRTYARVQGADPVDMPDGSNIWCAGYIDFDYYQAYLLWIDQKSYVAVLTNVGRGSRTEVEWSNHTEREHALDWWVHWTHSVLHNEW